MDKKQYTGTFDCIAKTVRSKGLPGLFRGNASTMMREARAPRSVVAMALSRNCLPHRREHKTDSHPVTAP